MQKHESIIFFVIVMRLSFSRRMPRQPTIFRTASSVFSLILVSQFAAMILFVFATCYIILSLLIASRILPALSKLTAPAAASFLLTTAITPCEKAFHCSWFKGYTFPSK
jgi:uncharacterized membrane protein